MKSIWYFVAALLLLYGYNAKAQNSLIDYDLLNSFLRSQVDTTMPFYYLEQVKQVGEWEFDKMHLKEKYNIGENAVAQLRQAFIKKTADTLWDCKKLMNASCLSAKKAVQVFKGEIKIPSPDSERAPIIWSVSEPAYDANKEFALISIGYSFPGGRMCGYYAVYLFKKTDDSWQRFQILGIHI